MVLQTILIIIEWLRNILLAIALLYGVKTIKALFKTDSKNQIIGMKRIVFTLIALGIAFLLIGFLVQNLTGGFVNNFSLVSAIFFTIAYLFLIAAFAYFWHDSSKYHKLHISEPVFFLGVSAGVMLWLYYFFRIVMISKIDTLYERTVLVAFPVAVAIIFLLTLIIHPAHKAKVIRTPLWYISSGVFMYFIAFNIMLYSLLRHVARKRRSAGMERQ